MVAPALSVRHLTKPLLAIFIGWGIYVADQWMGTYTLFSHIAHILSTKTIRPMPEEASATIADVHIEDMPDILRSDDTIAADYFDQYIKLGDRFFHFDYEIRRFILAHEMAHYRECHNAREIFIYDVILPLIFLCLYMLILASIYAFYAPRAWLYAWHNSVYWISIRAGSIHTLHIQKIMRCFLYSLSLAIIASFAYFGCRDAHDVIHPYMQQYIEYRADIQAIVQTHDVEAPCRLLEGKGPNAASHPPHPQRRAYMHFCKEHGYMTPTWKNLTHILTSGQLCAAIIYHISDYCPVTWYARIAIPTILRYFSPQYDDVHGKESKKVKGIFRKRRR